MRPPLLASTGSRCFTFSVSLIFARSTRCFALALFILCLTLCESPQSVASSISEWPVLQDGLHPSVALFPESASAARFCVDSTSADADPSIVDASIAASGTWPDVGPCVTLHSPTVCFSQSDLQSVWSKAEIFQSLYSRFDLHLTVETQSDPASLLETEIIRLLLSEVGGYSVRIVQNVDYHTQLPRCHSRKLDFHPYIWRTDWTNDEWAAEFASDIDERVCEIAGHSGLIGRNGWFADTHSVNDAAQNRDLALDFFRDYAKPQAVAGLPPLNLTEALADTVNTWYIPTICRQPGQACGVAYGLDPNFELGTPEQQIHNLGWLIAIVFPPTHEEFQTWVTARTNAKLQTLFFHFAPDPLSATSTVTRVALSDPTEACYRFPDNFNAQQASIDGIGPVHCDFRPQSLLKLAILNGDTDKNDAFTLFERMEIQQESLMEGLSFLWDGLTTAEVACVWARNNTNIWADWFDLTTPRKHVVQLPARSAKIMYAFLSFYLFCSMLSHAFLFHNRLHPLVRRSSHTFSQIIMCGSDVFYVTLFVGLQPDSFANCITSQFLFSVSFSLFYVGILVKSFRVERVYANQNLKVVHLPDSILAFYLGCYAAIDLLLVIIWSIVDAPHPMLVAHSTTAYASVSICSSANTNLFKALLYILRGGAILVGIFFAIRIRNVNESFNESKFIALMSYQILIASAIVLGITTIASNDPTIVVGSWMAGISLAVFASIIAFILPKVIQLHLASLLRVGPQQTLAAGQTPGANGTPQFATPAGTNGTSPDRDTGGISNGRGIGGSAGAAGGIVPGGPKTVPHLHQHLLVTHSTTGDEMNPFASNLNASPEIQYMPPVEDVTDPEFDSQLQASVIRRGVIGGEFTSQQISPRHHANHMGQSPPPIILSPGHGGGGGGGRTLHHPGQPHTPLTADPSRNEAFGSARYARSRVGNGVGGTVMFHTPNIGPRFEVTGEGGNHPDHDADDFHIHHRHHHHHNGGPDPDNLSAIVQSEHEQARSSLAENNSSAPVLHPSAISTGATHI